MGPLPEAQELRNVLRSGVGPAGVWTPALPRENVRLDLPAAVSGEHREEEMREEPGRPDPS